jgi:hypothetical protein
LFADVEFELPPPQLPPGFADGNIPLLIFCETPPCPPGAVIIEPNVVFDPFDAACDPDVAPAPPVPIVTV